MKQESVNQTGSEAEQKWYCNPLVLPDYPNLQVLSAAPQEDPWHRAGKTIMTERELMLEIGADPIKYEELGLAFYVDGFGRKAENDVRSTADPTALYHDGKWYLYVSNGKTYVSEDMIVWRVHEEPTWDRIARPMAPTVEAFRGKFYATANCTPMQEADSPLGPWRCVGEFTLPDGREVLCCDSMLFADEGHLYLYFGLGVAIAGVELDPERPNRFLTMPKILIEFNPLHEWERTGNNHEDYYRGWIEGVWMLKTGDTYRLIYSSCGTENYTYCMGAYVSDIPLGDFKPQKKNPVSSSRHGLIRGGGHGSFVKGPKDTLWCFYTVPLVYDHKFERRIGMDAAGIDEEGNLFVRTGTENPQWMPGVSVKPEEGNDTGLLNVSFMKNTKVSSCCYGREPIYALDDVLHTWWEPEVSDTAPEFCVALQAQYYVSAIRLIWKEVGLDFAGGIMPGPIRYTIETLKFGEDTWKTVVDASDNTEDLTVDFRIFPETEAYAVRLKILGAPKGVTPGLINFSVFGECVRSRELCVYE